MLQFGPSGSPVESCGRARTVVRENARPAYGRCMGAEDASRVDRLMAALEALGYPTVAEQVEASPQEQVTELRLLNALFGVVERLLYAAEDAAITESDPNSTEADRVVGAARREELRAAVLVEGPEANLLETLDTRIARTSLTLWEQAGAMLDGRDASAGPGDLDEVLPAAATALRAASALCAWQAGIQGGQAAVAEAKSAAARVTAVLDQLPPAPAG
jgi:hypothetical protein